MKEEIKRYDQELADEAKLHKELLKRSNLSLNNFSSNKTEAAESKAERIKLWDEVDQLIDSILAESMENWKKAKDAQWAGLQGIESNKAGIFDEIIAEDAKIWDWKLEIEQQNAVLRNNSIVLASKEFDLKSLE